MPQMHPLYAVYQDTLVLVKNTHLQGKSWFYTAWYLGEPSVVQAELRLEKCYHCRLSSYFHFLLILRGTRPLNSSCCNMLQGKQSISTIQTKRISHISFVMCLLPEVLCYLSISYFLFLHQSYWSPQ